MTAYTPFPKIIINGDVEYADQTISSISISQGRPDIYQQPQAGLASVELFGDVDTALNIALGNSLAIQVKKSDGSYATIYSGQITDMDISISNYGATGNIVVYRITALGTLSLLNKRLAGEFGYSKEFDGTRIFNILTEAFLQSYDEVVSTLKYNQIPDGVTFNSFDGSSAPVINTLSTQINVPGSFELTAYSAETTNALTLAQEAAQSARGVLYEGKDGSLFYDDYNSRAVTTPVVLTEDDIEAESLTNNTHWAEIVNDVTVEYKNGQKQYSEEPQSQLIYGQLAGSKVTTLEKYQDAQRQADDYRDSRAFPKTYPSGITIPLHSPTVSDATRDALIDMNVSSPIYTNELPAIFGAEFNGFVEGMRWELTRYTARLTLTCSAVSETYPHIIWLQLPTNQTWATYNATTKWEDL